MELTLRKHDAKKGGQANWRKDSVSGLISHAQDELDEVDHALTVEEMAREAVDLGNMAMMIWDRQLQLQDALDQNAMDKPLFTMKFSIAEDGDLKVSTVFHAQYAGIDLVRVMASGAAGLMETIMDVGRRMGLTEEQVHALIVNPNYEPSIPSAPPPSASTSPSPAPASS
jgi:hypothetical protein